MITEKQRPLDCLQAGRGIASVLVVLFHLVWYFSRDPRYWRQPGFEWLSFGNLGVSFFFVLSGLVMLLAHWKDVDRPASLVRYVIKRFRRIYPIYWVVLLPALCALWTHPSRTDVDAAQPLTVLSAITLIHFHSDDLVLLVSWTLFHEVLFYFGFAFLLWRAKVGRAVLALWFLACTFMAIHPFGPSILRQDLSPLHLLFLAGMVVTVFMKRGVQLPRWWALGIGAALLLSAAYWTNQAHVASEHQLLLAGLGSFFLLIGLVQLEAAGSLRVPGWLNLLGDASYSIYLIHFPLLSLVMRVVSPASRRLPVPLWIWFTLLAVFATGAGVVFHLVIERPLLRRFSGRRALSGGTAASPLEGTT